MGPDGAEPGAAPAAPAVGARRRRLGGPAGAAPAAPGAADGLSAALEASLAMAQAALAVRRRALDALLAEVAALRAENDLLAAGIADPGLGALRARLRQLEVRRGRGARPINQRGRYGRRGPLSACAPHNHALPWPPCTRAPGRGRGGARRTPGRGARAGRHRRGDLRDVGRLPGERLGEA
jgi:hypothetical protein